MLHMKERRSQCHPSLRIMLICLVISLVSCQPQPPSVQSPPAPAGQETQPSSPTPASTQPRPLPQTASPSTPSLPKPLFGVEVNQVAPAMLDQLREIGVNIVRRNGLLWSSVEPVKGQRNWENVADLEKGLELLGSSGFQTILIVRGTPDWAQKVSGSPCGPIKRKELAAFARFMQDVVARYSVSPYHVKYWELWNEPDVDPSLVSQDSPMGCWGVLGDEYYGGQYYAEMLKAVYPAIKAADPQAQVMIGGLLADCDPTHPPEGSDCSPSRFLEGILKGGGGSSFDILSFHGYPPYTGSLEMDARLPGWAARGGVVLGKINYFREVMTAYGVDKPIMHTESSLVCPEWASDQCNPPGSAFFEAQSDYIVILFVRNWASGIAGTIWYQFEGPGWRYVGLLDQAGAPKPAYYALKFLNQELGGAQYSGTISEYPSVKGFSFTASDKRIWVLWSADGQPQTLVLPVGTRQVLNKYGNPVSFQGNSLVVNSPFYIELSP